MSEKNIDCRKGGGTRHEKQICPTPGCGIPLLKFGILAMFEGTQVPSVVMCPKCKERFQVIKEGYP